MKKLLKVLKITALSVVGLILLLIISLVVYYEINYTPTELPAEIKPLALINATPTIPNNPVMLPVPKKIVWSSGHFLLSANIHFSAPKADETIIKNIIQNRLDVVANCESAAAIKFSKNSSLTTQAYRLSILPNQISVEYNDYQGLFFAITTIKQLAKQSNNALPCVNIDDSPDLKTRGAMLDISRGKVPKLETLYEMVDFLADLKYNHLELYVEGFSFGYPSFKNLWEKTETPLSPEEIKLLDAYCKDRFIELVPNQNSLGHMDAWLATKEFKDLAECPDGYKFMGLITMKSTMAPKNPQSLELVKKMSEDLLPNFSSNQFNVNLDEPFELGKSKDHPIKDPKEIARVYIDYAKRLNDYVNSKGKNMLMWGDIISRNPEFINEIPKNITLLEWRYESFQDFDAICKKYQASGHHYMVCPGTSSWSDFTGRTDNMLGNIENAVRGGVKYGADGMLITDWGDKPHLQYLTVSYPGLAYGGALSWNANSNAREQLGNYLSKSVFQDQSNKAGDIVLNLGRYNDFEEYPMLAGTTTGWALRFGFMDKMMSDAIFHKFQSAIFDLLPMEGNVKELLHERFDNPHVYNPGAIIQFVDYFNKELAQNQIKRKDSALIIDEYRNAIKMIKLCASLKQYNNYHLQQTAQQNKAILTEMKSLCATIIPEHKRLWLLRNKNGGLDGSLESIVQIQTQVNDKLDMLDKNFIIRWGSRTSEKVITAAATWFLK